eukprot:COSAG01_NODE_1594_length_9789_cov_98.477399_2_plen_79_part_00
MSNQACIVLYMYRECLLYLYMYVQYCMYIVVNVLGIPSQCFFSPKMSDSGGLQDAMQYCRDPSIDSIGHHPLLAGIRL